MILEYCRKSTVSILAGSLIFITPGAEAAGSLAGSKGDVRYPVYRAPGSTGGCGKHYRGYVAARGHSAYAMTPFNWSAEYTICGVSLNASSQQAAEAKALKSCESGRKQWKVSTAGPCSIAASK
ncbi:hypothetical protein [Mesorhizobium sp. LjNodule214]|uniref:hypothetical protein n=1 Tax=Mesorhizobium sp. LjNodule214 TaxID=3342252 RepID=UPI003ECD4999